MARPIAKDHSEKRAHILRVAARVFANGGIARASMAQVAEACGVSKANIYHYYDSKDALVFDILDSYLRTLRDRLAQLDGQGENPASQLLRFVNETLLAYEGMDAEHQIQTDGIASLGRKEQEILKSYQRDMVVQLGDILRLCAPPHLVGTKAELKATTMSVFGMLNWFYMWNRNATQVDRTRYAEHVAALVLGRT
ncbi:TetR family transcriptional regulator [Planktotalea sp.]|uniref:TetR/AcrR family transcriptional regulator n=1 Tax=Planktotalea sp. TaxID=2029877 RepID=UPI0025CC93DA|nr:TetR family transcriptional regulator [Planktotalea sp.]